jgi:hypothetical protein
MLFIHKVGDEREILYEGIFFVYFNNSIAHSLVCDADDDDKKGEPFVMQNYNF